MSRGKEFCETDRSLLVLHGGTAVPGHTAAPMAAPYYAGPRRRSLSKRNTASRREDATCDVSIRPCLQIRNYDMEGLLSGACPRTGDYGRWMRLSSVSSANMFHIKYWAMIIVIIFAITIFLCLRSYEITYIWEERGRTDMVVENENWKIFGGWRTVHLLSLVYSIEVIADHWCY